MSYYDMLHGDCSWRLGDNCLDIDNITTETEKRAISVRGECKEKYCPRCSSGRPVDLDELDEGEFEPPF